MPDVPSFGWTYKWLLIVITHGNIMQPCVMPGHKWLLIVITHGNIMQPCVMRLGGGITQGCIIFPCVLTISSHLCPPKTGDIRHNSTIPDPETTLACQNGSLHSVPEWLPSLQYISVPEWLTSLQYISVPEWLPSLQYISVPEWLAPFTAIP